MTERSSVPGTGRLFVALLLTFGGISAWLLAQGYASDFAMHRWAKALTLTDASDLRVEKVGLLYPHAPIYLLAILSRVPGLHSPFLPYLLAVLAAAGTLTLWNHHLAGKGYTTAQRWALVALTASHPMLLWAITTGMHNALTLLVFYLFCFGCTVVVMLRDVRSIIFAGVVLALLFFTDERTGYIFLALLPLLPFLAPKKLVVESPLSAYALIGFPLLVAIAAWIYLNWIFHGDPWLFLEAPEASFRGAWGEAQSQAWLMRVGGGILEPFVLGLAMAAVCFPAPLWIAWRHRRQPRIVRPLMVLFAHLVVALAMASADFFLAEPAAILFLESGVVMAALILAPRLRGREFTIVAGLLLVGSLGAAVLIRADDSSELQHWRRSLVGSERAQRFPADQRLGRWLAENRFETMIDDRVAYRAIVARGDARELVLPFDDRFKLALKRREPDIRQIVVVNPNHAAAAGDRVTQRFPELYGSGLPGFALAYDLDHWRVWRRVE